MMDEFNDREDFEWSELADQFKEAVDKGDPLFLDSYELEEVTHYLLATSEYSYAHQAIVFAKEKYPWDSVFPFLEVDCYALQNDFKRAEKLLNHIETQFGCSSQLCLKRAILSQVMDNNPDVKDLLQQAVNLDGENAEAHLRLSLELVANHNIEEAVHHTLEAIRINPDNASFLRFAPFDPNSPYSFHSEDLITFFQRLSEELPMSWEIWDGLGFAYMCSEEFDKAAEAFEFQISLDINEPVAYANLAEAQYAGKQYKEAIQNYRAAASRFKSLSFDVQIGRCYLRMHDYDQALKHFTSVHEDDPLYHVVFHEIADVFKEQGKFDEARAYLRNHLQKDPINVDAILALLDILHPDTDEAEIRDLCFIALHRDKDPDLYVLFDIVDCLYHADAPDLGIELCQEFFDNENLKNIVHYLLAALYIRKGMVDEGCRYLEFALQENPNSYQLNFLSIDADLAKIPEVSEILRIYIPEFDKNQHNEPAS